VTLRNLIVQAEGEAFDVSGAVYIVGNFSMGGFEFYDGTIVALEPGEHELSIVITYDLDTGERLREVHSAIITVTEGFEGDFGDFGMGGMGGGMVTGRQMPGGGMIIMEGVGGRGGMAGGMGMDGMGFDMDGMGFDEPRPEGFVNNVVHFARRGLNFANTRVWPWIILGGVSAAFAAFVIVKSAKRRAAYTL
jgi:hypothetical protein